MHCVSFLVPSDLSMLTLPKSTQGGAYDFSNPIRKAETPEQILLDEAPCRDTTFQHAKGSGERLWRHGARRHIPAALRASHLVRALWSSVQEHVMLRVSFVFDVPPFVERLAALKLSSDRQFRYASDRDAAL
jgi:hypothetical protein